MGVGRRGAGGSGGPVPAVASSAAARKVSQKRAQAAGVPPPRGREKAPLAYRELETSSDEDGGRMDTDETPPGSPWVPMGGASAGAAQDSAWVAVAAERAAFREEQNAAFEASLAADREKERQRSLERERAAEAERLAREAQVARERAEADRVRDLELKRDSLPEEPPAGGEDVVVVAVRLPGGGRCSRRFKLSDPSESLYSFVDSQALTSASAPAEVGPGRYRLCANFPRRVVGRPGEVPAGHSLAAAGLQRGQEALFMEPVA